MNNPASTLYKQIKLEIKFMKASGIQSFICS